MNFNFSVISKAKARFSDTKKQLTNKKGHEDLNCLTELTMYDCISILSKCDYVRMEPSWIMDLFFFFFFLFTINGYE